MTARSTCSECGFENPRSFRACAKCGTRLEGAGARRGLTTLADVTSSEAQATVPSSGDTLILSDERTISHEVRLSEPVADDKEPPLVGQEEASQAIYTAVERAFALGAPTLLALEGPHGSGRTRLLFHASEVAAHLDPKVHVVYCACRSRDGIYAPFSRMLLERFGVTPASAPSVIRGQMSTAVSSALGTADVVRVAETTHLLGHLAGVPFPDSPFLISLSDRPEELHRRALLALRRILEGDASKRPLLLLLDDMQNAEDAAWEVIGELCQADGPIAVILAGDAPLAERAAAFEPTGGSATGAIARLDEEGVRALLGALIPNLLDIPDALAAALAHRSGGIPREVRELTFALWEAGLFERVGGAWRVLEERLSDESMPVTTSDAIRARLSRLDDLERATVERGAVVGETFWDGAILGQMRSERGSPGRADDPLSIWADDDDAIALARALERLQDKGFLEAEEGGDLPGAREYRFALEGTRTLLYETMDEEVRTMRHAAVARWLSVLPGVPKGYLSSLMAPHLERAGQRIGAGRAYFAAASSDRVDRRTTRALWSVEKALELLPEDDTEVRLQALHEHGSLLTLLGQYDRAIESFSAMLTLAWGIGARGKGGAALNRIARVLRQRGEHDEAISVLDRALELFRQAGDLRGVAACQDDRAQIQLLRGEVETAMRAAREALEIRRAHGDRRGEALSLTTLGQLELRRGNVSAADAMIRAGLDIREGIGDLEGTLQSYAALGRLCFERGDRRDATRAWQTGLIRAREHADRPAESLFLNELGECMLVEGRLESARDALSRAKELAREHGDRRSAALIERNLGRLAMREGSPEAAGILDSALALAASYGGKEVIALVHRSVGQLRARTLYDPAASAGETAEESFLCSIDLFREVGNEKEAARSLMDLGLHLIERGDRESARERLTEARAIFRQMGLPEADAVGRLLAEL